MPRKLRRRLLFADLGSPAEVEAMLAQGRTAVYAAKQVICEEGDASTGLFVIIEGSVEFFLRRGKQPAHNIYLDEQGAGEYFGEHGLFDSEPRSAAALARVETTCRVIDREPFLSWLLAHPEVGLSLLRHASARIRDLSSDLRASTGSAYERVARYLAQAAVTEEKQLVVRDMPSKKQLARQLGISREHASHILNDLERGGYIEARKGVVLLRRALPESY